MSAPLIRLTGVGKRYGALEALRAVDLEAHAGEVTCVLGDNGAGKSTLIKIVAGLHPHDDGVVEVDGNAVRYASPREALAHGIATVFQDLALAPLMPVWANLFLGQELEAGWGPLRRMDVARMREVTRAALADLGTDLPDVDRPVADLSGGQRQCVAIARAIHFGARALVLDEPTAALGVRQAGMVLRQVAAAKARGLAVILITHNPNHAYAVGNRFLVLQRGAGQGAFRRAEITVDALARQMAGELAEQGA
ncbi:MAG: sugar ABC transporter ATP-binding protein [Phenylobacterium sp.]|uniref:ATP-binding cassette domain-containing protein n=1 Tax=Phenylobacterium sp. TaxID=1871053 RepID=UPI001A5342E9|nr:ATP-binding cassette domain-containing protein [Phenylobacterium sp.]MBL8555430.1 sugar ABC transporter ATP-binding protein [Phenylobacterium sp.]